MPQIEKRPGEDWVIYYLDGESFQSMSVFGAKDIDEALRDARASFGDAVGEIEFVGCIRLDVDLNF